MNQILYKNRNILDGTLLSYFMDFNILDNLYKIRSKAMCEEIEYEPKIELQIDIIENEIIGILEKKSENRTTEENKVIELARKYYSNFYLKNKLSSIYCKLYESKNLEKLFTSDICKEIDYFNNKRLNQVYGYYVKFMNGEALSNIEQVVMFSFFTSKIGTVSKKFYIAQQNVIKKLLSMKENYSVCGKNFYIQFITYEKCKKLNLPVAKVYIGNKNFNGEEAKWLGVSKGDTGLVIMKEEYLKHSPSDFLELKNVPYDVSIAQTMHHELEHYRQSCLMLKGVVNKTSMNMIKSRIFREYLSTKDYDEYMANYRYKETEREANITGWKETVDFFMEYSTKDRLRDIQKASNQHCKTFLEQSYSWQTKNINGKIKSFSLEDYNIRNLYVIVKKNPNLVDKYPQLKLFFHENGNFKNGGELLRDYTNKQIVGKFDKEEKEVYREFFDANFMNIDLFSINLNNYNANEQMNLFILIQEAYSRECRQLKRMMDIYDKNKEKEFDFIGKMRIDRIKKYYSYLIANQGLIRNLSKVSQIQHFGFLYKESLNTDVESFEDRIRHNSIFRGTLLEKEILDLTKMMGEEEYERRYGSRSSR